jgi:CAAX protease family protein
MSNDSSNDLNPAPAPIHYTGSATKPPKPPKKGGATAPKMAHVPWGPWMAIGYALLLYVVAEVLGSMLVVMYPHLRGWDKAMANDWLDHSIIAQFMFVLVADTLTFGGLWWYMRHRKATWRSIGWRWPRWKDPVYTLAGYLVYFLAYAVLLALATNAFPSLNIDQKQNLGFTNVAGTANLLLTFGSLVVLPPLVEETLFRGFVFTGLRTRLHPVYAAVITSVVFASLHLEIGNGTPLVWVAALDTFTLSLVLCYLRHKTDSLWPGILLHGLKNCVAFASLYLIVPH